MVQMPDTGQKPFKIASILFPASTNWKYWMFLALLIKSFLFFWQIHTYNSKDAFWGLPSDDISNYFTPIENLIHNGHYTIDCRMPGYGALYLPFILLFSQGTAMNMVILVQLIFSSVSVYALALIAKKILNNHFIFYATFFLYAISYFTSTYDPVILTESLSTSVLVLAVYYLVTFLTDKPGKKYLFYSGMFLTWGMFLRPVLAPVFLFFILILLFYSRKEKNISITAIILFLIPVTLTDGAWIIRNYTLYHRIIPLTKTEYLPTYDDVYIPTDKFVQAWGGGVARNYHQLDFSTVPDEIYTSAFNADSLKLLHNLRIKGYSLPLALRAKNDSIIINKLITYTKSIKQEKPFLYFVKAPLRQMRSFLTMWRLFSVLFFIKSMGGLLSLFYSIIYYGILFSGFLGSLLLLKKCIKQPLTLILTGIPFYIIVIHTIVLRLCENRYLVPAYPFMLVCAVYFVLWAFKGLKALTKAH